MAPSALKSQPVEEDASRWLTPALVGTVALSFLAELPGSPTEMKANISGFRTQVNGDFKSLRAEPKDGVRVSHHDLSARMDQQEVAINQMPMERKEEIRELRKGS